MHTSRVRKVVNRYGVIGILPLTAYNLFSYAKKVLLRVR